MSFIIDLPNTISDFLYLISNISSFLAFFQWAEEKVRKLNTMIEGVQISDSGISMMLIVQFLCISKLQEKCIAKAQ